MGWPFPTMHANYVNNEPFSSNMFSIQGSDECLTQDSYFGMSIPTTAANEPPPKRHAKLEIEEREEVDGHHQVCTGTTCDHGPRFMLKAEIKPKQRKSYKNENRYLLPNPTQIVLTEEGKNDRRGVTVVKATCKVKIYDGNGKKLSRQVNYYLENTEGGLVVDMEGPALTFDYFLKVRQNSGPDKFSLHFVIRYTTTDGHTHKEKIVSTPFLVQSNKSFFSKDPKLSAIQPPAGLSCRSNEVWIKGRDFNEKGVKVTVDSVEATIVEVQPNLIVLLMPERNDLTQDHRATVSVYNVFKHKRVPSEQELDYVYVVASKDGRVDMQRLSAASALARDIKGDS